MDGALGKGPDGMSEIADISVAPTPRLSRTSFQHVPVHSVDACIEIVGAAIVRHVFGDIGVATARQKKHRRIAGPGCTAPSFKASFTLMRPHPLVHDVR